MATIAEEITDQEAWLVILKASRKELGEAGAVKRLEKGDFSGTYHSLAELEQEIRRVKNSIVMLERTTY